MAEKESPQHAAQVFADHMRSLTKDFTVAELQDFWKLTTEQWISLVLEARLGTHRDDEPEQGRMGRRDRFRRRTE